MMNGRLYVVSGPSGCGKGTVIGALLQEVQGLELSISCTTRSPRDGDIEGVTYYFKTEQEFLDMIEQGAFLEYEQVYAGRYYGTPKEIVLRKLDEGTDMLLEIDVYGALKVKENFPDAVLIYIMPPSREILLQRLRGRGTETEEQIQMRFAKSEEEMEQARKYDHVIVNDVLRDAVDQVKAIMRKSEEKI